MTMNQIVVEPEALETLDGLEVLPPSMLPQDRHPAAVYLASLSEGPGRASMQDTLNQVAALLSGNRLTAQSLPWHLLRFQHIAALRSYLAGRFAPATTNKTLSAIRGVLKSAWRLGLIDTEEYSRAVDVPNVKGSRLPAGRALEQGELIALFGICRADTSPAGARDAAAFALMFGAGLRRAEAAAAQRSDYDLETDTLRVVGKGNRERAVYFSNGGKAALSDWFQHRGLEDGPLLCQVNKSGQILRGKADDKLQGLTPRALVARLKLRAKQAGVADCSPHDLRRSFVSGLLDSGADIAIVQRLAGHASPTTTSRYDRRGEEAARQGAALLHVPYRRQGED